jgi:nickel transport protein
MMTPFALIRRWMAGCGLGVALLLCATAAHAHRVVVFAWVEGDSVHTESTFGNGRAVKGGTIEVYDDSDTKLLTGITDTQGRFAFPVPTEGDLKIVVNAGMGHTAHWILEADENDRVADRDPDPGSAMSAKALFGVAEHAASAPHAGAASCVDAKAVEQIVQNALDKRFAAFEVRLAAQRPSPWREVTAGLGYILGLVGLAAYMRNRRDNQK